MRPEPQGSEQEMRAPESPMTHPDKRLVMHKCTGFAVDHKHALACVVHAGWPLHIKRPAAKGTEGMLCD
jgi:hypothetical protein